MLQFSRFSRRGLAITSPRPGCFEKGLAVLAGNGSREEDCSTKKIQPEETPCRARLRSIRFCKQKSDAKEIPGVVAVAASGKDIIYQGAFGKRDLAKDDAMTADSVFWIASMTKAVTAAAAMQMVEQGKLSLDQPGAKEILPFLADTKVLLGFDANDIPIMRAAPHPDHPA